MDMTMRLFSETCHKNLIFISLFMQNREFEYIDFEVMILQHEALCVIFTILVSFSRDNALFASKAKLNILKFFQMERPAE